MTVKAENLTLEYNGLTVFSNISFTIREGETLLLTGRNGSGKTSLLKLVSGIIPWIKPGKIKGQLYVDNINPLENPDPLAYKVRMLPPDPQQFLLAPTPYDDIGLSLSILGMSNIEERVREITSKLDLTGIMYSPILELSSGQQQKTAIASTIAPGVKCLLLDEPISHLDWVEKENFLKLMMELKDNGFCSLIATHYPEYFREISDRVVILGEYLPDKCDVESGGKEYNSTPIVLRASNISYNYPNGYPALKNVNVELLKGEIIIIYGRNGSGKSTLLYTLAGILKPSQGKINYTSKPAVLPSDPVKIFTMPTLRKELSDYGVTQDFVKKFGIEELIDRPLTYLSTGELKKSALIVLFASGSRILLMDEPEAGLDPTSRCFLAKLITGLASLGVSIIITTHDREFGGMVATRELLLENGELKDAD
ncbi:MAG: energy-coupling factor ABC transporter ATP-binding protein [Desulfurococcales archaeon]|nr:energy-coupling factor ABC transporter ATP-binding protein [Desulfurococcales archaeon]